jgi:hypothetical protein
MITLAYLKDLPRIPLALRLVKSKDEAEQLAAQFPAWYFVSSDGKYKTLFTQPKETEK